MSGEGGEPVAFEPAPSGVVAPGAAGAADGGEGGDGGDGGRGGDTPTTEAPLTGTSRIGAAPEPDRRLRRLRAALPAVGAGAATGAAGLVTAVASPTWRPGLVGLAAGAALVAALGTARSRTWPGTLAVGSLGGAYCVAAASEPVDVAATALVAVVLFVAFQVATSPGGRPAGRSSASMALLTLAAAAGPVVMVLARGVGTVPAHLFLPAMGAGVAAVVAPVLVVARLVRPPAPREPSAGA